MTYSNDELKTKIVRLISSCVTKEHCISAYSFVNIAVDNIKFDDYFERICTEDHYYDMVGMKYMEIGNGLSDT